MPSENARFCEPRRLLIEPWCREPIVRTPYLSMAVGYGECGRHVYPVLVVVSGGVQHTEWQPAPFVGLSCGLYYGGPYLVVNRTCGIHKNLYQVYFTIFTNIIRPYQVLTIFPRNSIDLSSVF